MEKKQRGTSLKEKYAASEALFPAQKVLAKPTNINNVETFANIPWLLLTASCIGAYGTPQSKGTRYLHWQARLKGGLVEVPMGLPLKSYYGIGGGIKDDKEFKAVQMGGPSGGCIPASLADTGRL